MTLEQAKKKFMGKTASYQRKQGKIIRLAHPWTGKDEAPDDMIIAELDNGIVVNLELLIFPVTPPI